MLVTKTNMSSPIRAPVHMVELTTMLTAAEAQLHAELCHYTEGTHNTPSLTICTLYISRLYMRTKKLLLYFILFKNELNSYFMSEDIVLHSFFYWNQD